MVDQSTWIEEQASITYYTLPGSYNIRFPSCPHGTVAGSITYSLKMADDTDPPSYFTFNAAAR
jgi:hypothetical protein